MPSCLSLSTVILCLVRLSGYIQPDHGLVPYTRHEAAPLRPENCLFPSALALTSLPSSLETDDLLAPRSCSTFTEPPYRPPTSNSFSIMPSKHTRNAQRMISQHIHSSPSSRHATLLTTFSPCSNNKLRGSVSLDPQMRGGQSGSTRPWMSSLPLMRPLERVSAWYV
jgi:hypothetical protein